MKSKIITPQIFNLIILKPLKGSSTVVHVEGKRYNPNSKQMFYRLKK
jgi:hypothetical protein